MFQTHSNNDLNTRHAKCSLETTNYFINIIDVGLNWLTVSLFKAYEMRHVLTKTVQLHNKIPDFHETVAVVFR